MPAIAIPIIAAGVSAAGSVAASKIASNAQSKSQKAQLLADTQAQGAVTKAYQTGQPLLADVSRQQQANLNPYQQLGQQALGALGARFGSPQMANTGVVPVRDPQGIIRHVPQAMVQQALASGGTVVR